MNLLKITQSTYGGTSMVNSTGGGDTKSTLYLLVCLSIQIQIYTKSFWTNRFIKKLFGKTFPFFSPFKLKVMAS